MRENDKDNLISMNDSEDFILGMQAVCWCEQFVAVHNEKSLETNWKDEHSDKSGIIRREVPR